MNGQAAAVRGALARRHRDVQVEHETLGLTFGPNQLDRAITEFLKQSWRCCPGEPTPKLRFLGLVLALDPAQHQYWVDGDFSTSDKLPMDLRPLARQVIEVTNDRNDVEAGLGRFAANEYFKVLRITIVGVGRFLSGKEKRFVEIWRTDDGSFYGARVYEQ